MKFLEFYRHLYTGFRLPQSGFQARDRGCSSSEPGGFVFIRIPASYSREACHGSYGGSVASTSVVHPWAPAKISTWQQTGFFAGMITSSSEFIDCRITDIVAVLFQFLPLFQ